MRIYGWPDSRDTYETWRSFIIQQCGDSRALDSETANVLQAEAVKRNDEPMLIYLDLLLGD